MYKVTKKIICIFSAAVLAAGAASLSACGTSFTPVADKDTSYASVESNGGFVVATGDYYYFINGVETYSSDNTFGGVEKGALMRIKKTDVAKKNNTAEVVIPSIMYEGGFKPGFYIYGDRIYYSTPNNVKNTSGKIESEYLDFKSAKLDGTDVKHYFRLADNTTDYRYVTVGETVYLMYAENGTDLHSYNVSTGDNTIIVKGADSYYFNSDDKTDPNVYYAMSVTYEEDQENPISPTYKQIYRVSADATEAPYDYTWDEDWLNDNDEPYLNYGELVLDGIGQNNTVTQYNHDVNKNDDKRPAIGYTYTMQSYSNNGIYFTREYVSNLTSTGKPGGLYYLPVSAIGNDGDTITLNDSDSLDFVANSVNTSKASASALFYLDGEGNHHYLYVDGDCIRRADVEDEGNETDLEIAYDVSGATLVSIDTESDKDYDYVYYTRASGSGLSVERAVFNGNADNYANLQYKDEDNSAYKPVVIEGVTHAAGWYDFEIIDNYVFFANAETFGADTYNYVYYADLKNDDGTLMNNAEIETRNDLYNEIFDTDAKTGFLAKVTDKLTGNLSDVFKYYFYTGDKELTYFYENIKEAEDAGKKTTYLYSQDEQDLVKAFMESEENEKLPAVLDDFTDENGDNYFAYSYFATLIGKQTDEDIDAFNTYWKDEGLQIYTPEETEESGLAWWAWLLIAIAIAVVVAAAIVTPTLIVKKLKKKDDDTKVERLKVDTTDNRDIDVYNLGKEETSEDSAPEEVIEESVEEPAPAEEVSEQPVEETAEPEPAEETVTEEPVAGEPVAETAEETTPAEEPADDAAQDGDKTDGE